MNSNRPIAKPVIMTMVYASFVVASAFSQALELPAWTGEPGSPITFQGGQSVDASQAEAALYGFPGTARGIGASGDGLTIQSFELAPPPNGRFLTPEDSLPTFHASPIFRDLSLKRGFAEVLEADCSVVVTPDPFGGEFREGGVSLGIDGWNIVAERLTLGPDGLSMAFGYIVSRYEGREPAGGVRSYGDAEAYAGVESLTFDASWTPVPGKDALAEPNASVHHSGQFNASSMSLQRTAGTLVATIVPGQAAGYKEEELPFERVVIDGLGRLIGSTLKTDPIVLGVEGGFRLEFVPSSMTDILTGTGSVVLSDALGRTGPFKTAPDAVRTMSTGGQNPEDFVVDAFAEPVSLSFRGWTIVSPDASIGKEERICAPWSLIAPHAIVNYNGMDIAFQDLAFTEDGYLVNGSVIHEPITLAIFGGRLSSIETTLTDKGLSIYAWAVLPSAFNDHGIAFGRTLLLPDGTFEIADSVPSTEFGTALGEFDMECIRLTEDGIKAESLYLKPYWKAVAKIRMYGVAVTNDGLLKAHTVDPFSIGAYYLSPYAMTADGDAIHIQGNIQYPRRGNLTYASYSDQASLTLPFDGSAPSLACSVVERTNLSFGRRGVLSAASRRLVIEGDRIILALDGVTVRTPMGRTGDAVIDNVRIAPDGAWDLSAAVLAAPFTYERDGVAYELSTLYMLNEQKVIFSGVAIRTGPSGAVSSNGCAVAFYLDGNVSAIVADVTDGDDGTDVTWTDWADAPAQRVDTE